jgi:hypothetical protein
MSPRSHAAEAAISVRGILLAENLFFCLRHPIYLQSVIIHSPNGGKGEGCLVEEYSVRGSGTGGDSGE